jgi:hypothetical protein
MTSAFSAVMGEARKAFHLLRWFLAMIRGTSIHVAVAAVTATNRRTDQSCQFQCRRKHRATIGFHLKALPS